MAYISFTPIFLFNLHNITYCWENCDLDDSIIFLKSQNLKAAKSDFKSGLLAASPHFHQLWFHFTPRIASDSTSISSSPPPMGRTLWPTVTKGQDQYLRRQMLGGLESEDEKLARAALTVCWGERTVVRALHFISQLGWYWWVLVRARWICQRKPGKIGLPGRSESAAAERSWRC